HKYDPIPQTDYYSLAGVFFNTIYEEYPAAPKKVIEDYLKLEEDLDNKQKILQEENQNASNQLSRSLALQISNYLQGVYEVSDKPSNFVSNKDFNPGSWLRLVSLPDDQNSLWTEIFQRELKDNEDPNAMMAAGGRQGNPGVLLFRGWGLQSRVGPEAQARLKSMQDDVDAARKKLDPHFPFIHGVKDSETPVNIQLALRGNPANLGDEVPRHFLSVFAAGDPKP